MKFNFWISFVVLLVGVPYPAVAYVDLSSVTVFVQTMVAILAGGLVALKIYWRRLTPIIRRFLGHLVAWRSSDNSDTR